MNTRELKEIYEANDNEWSDYTSKIRFENSDNVLIQRIVLYGAGKVGNILYKDLRDCGYEVILWVDRNYLNMPEEVTSPQNINNVEYDCIVIAVNDEAVIKEIRSDLKIYGADDKKIILYKSLLGNSKLDDLYKKRYDNMENFNYWEDSHDHIEFDQPYCVTSMICNQSFFDAPFVQFWADRVHRNFVDLMKVSNQLSDKCLKSNVVYHRKLWEFIYICQGFYERGMLAKGKRGVAFGVGTECLPDLFASMGCEILATDLNGEEAARKGWSVHEENIEGNYWKLNQYGFCDEETFERRVQYMDVDMNHIPSEIWGYDFCWSACALEHIGGIQAGLEFIKNSLKTLKPGGIAIHTTEYNLLSDERTFECDGLSLFRRKDIEQLVRDVESDGNVVYPIDWHIGENVVDGFIDIPPYSKKDMHLRLKIRDFPCTSIGLIIKKSM